MYVDCYVASKSFFCKLEREVTMGISTSNHKIKKQDEAIEDNKRLVVLDIRCASVVSHPPLHILPPLLLLWSQGEGQEPGCCRLQCTE